jgi:hypothetical protein
MKFGQGRPPKRLEIGTIREVGIEELRTTPRGKDPAVKRFRDYHHQMAKCFAMGMTSGQVAQVMGMSWSRVCIFQNDQAFQELVKHYRDSVDPTWRETHLGIMSQMQLNQAEALRIQAQQLEEHREGLREIPVGTVAKIIADLSDRVGFGKNQTLTVEHSFAAKLDKAIERSKLKTIEGRVESVAVLPTPSSASGVGEPESDGGSSSVSLAPPVSFAKRAAPTESTETRPSSASSRERRRA